MMLVDEAETGRWEHFRHGADIGIRGVGATRAQAFERAALALTAVVTDPVLVHCVDLVSMQCEAAQEEFLFLDWINALIYEMATRNMLFGRFKVTIDGATLKASVWGEAVNVARHAPAVEPKGATFTELAVAHKEEGWIAQCVVDV